MDDHPQLITALQNLPSSLPLRSGPWSKGAQRLLSWGQEACRTLGQVSLSEPSTLSLGPRVSTCPLILRPWLGLHLAHVSGCPDIAVTVASQELCVTHVGASRSSRNLSYPQTELWDSVTLLTLGPQAPHTPAAWLLGATTVPTGQSQHYCSCRGSRGKCRDKAEANLGEGAQKHLQRKRRWKEGQKKTL